MPSPFSRLSPALLAALLLAPTAQAAQAVKLLDLQPGTSRAEAGRLLAARFPQASVLTAGLTAGQKLTQVQPFDPAGCPGQPLCMAGWAVLDAAGQVQHSEIVQLAIRKEAVMGVRHQQLERAGEQCSAALQRLRASWQKAYGPAVEQKSTRRNEADYLLQQWGDCPAGGHEAGAHKGICLAASSGCSSSGELDSEISLTDYGRLRQ